MISPESGLYSPKCPPECPPRIRASLRHLLRQIPCAERQIFSRSCGDRKDFLVLGTLRVRLAHGMSAITLQSSERPTRGDLRGLMRLLTQKSRCISRLWTPYWSFVNFAMFLASSVECDTPSRQSILRGFVTSTVLFRLHSAKQFLIPPTCPPG